MSSTPDVSIAMPVYNGRDFLPACIDAILSQSGVDLELVVVDDASTDDSAALISERSDPRIRLLRNTTNQGIFPSLNAAVSACRAPLVQIFCQDDVMKPDCLRRQRAALQGHPGAGMVWCNYDDVDEQGRPWGTRTVPQYHDVMPALLTPRDAAVFFTVYGCMPGNLSPVMMARAAFAAVGGFDSAMTYAGDFDLWIRLAEAFPIVYSRDCLVAVRTHAERASHTLNAAQLTLIEEEGRIYERLKRALGERISRRDLDRYLAAARGYQYISWIMDHLRRGHGRVALQGVQYTRQSLGLGRCFAAYVRSLNGRRTLVDRRAMLRRLWED